MPYGNAVLGAANDMRELPSGGLQLYCYAGRISTKPRFRVVPDNLRNVPQHDELDERNVRSFEV